MTPIYLHNNKILVVGGKLAASEACCCQEDDCNDPSIGSKNPNPGCCVETISPIVADDFSLSCPDGWEGPNEFDATCSRSRCIDRCCDCGKGTFPTVLLGYGCTDCDQFNQFTECGECPQCDEAP
jgi:hypothetical protein